MKLYTNCRFCGQRFYLVDVYYPRKDMPQFLSMSCPYCQNTSDYHPNTIFAEPGSGAPLAGTALGAVVGGLIGGPIGLLIGGALGGTAGAGSEQKDKDAAIKFNQEVV